MGHHAEPQLMQSYASKRDLKYHRYSPYHMRIIYGDRVTLDCWTTGKYWVKECNYRIEKRTRGGQKGYLPTKKLYEWLDKLFFADEIREEKDREV